jgi:hypothetical protein
MTDTSASAPVEFLLYETEDGRTRVECRFAHQSVAATPWKMRAVRPRPAEIKKL